jgi:hypothetical protein
MATARCVWRLLRGACRLDRSNRVAYCPAFWLLIIPIGDLTLAHDLGQHCAIFVWQPAARVAGAARLPRAGSRYPGRRTGCGSPTASVAMGGKAIFMAPCLFRMENH